MPLLHRQQTGGENKSEIVRVRCHEPQVNSNMNWTYLRGKRRPPQS